MEINTFQIEMRSIIKIAILTIYFMENYTVAKMNEQWGIKGDQIGGINTHFDRNF